MKRQSTPFVAPHWLAWVKEMKKLLGCNKAFSDSQFLC